MTFDEAKEILKGKIKPNGGLFCGGHYMSWTPGDKEITLDCRFDIEELEAIVTYMKSYPSNNSAEKE